ncbi:hypothetical protein [Bradyrhizobium sp. Ai1a-2]|uniref:hypothetical protein n=1 Tax=Bradyrhizobium sp. Ai1a-2 TaxID=196490 RepID=UPI000485B31E|nr:hypothetical protein [Bradyrhizobium sp. Ai1a-2]
MSSSQGKIGDHRERIDVVAFCPRLAHQHLWRSISRGQLADLIELRRALIALWRNVEHQHRPKIEKFDFACWSHEDLARFDIAVDNAEAVYVGAVLPRPSGASTVLM